VSRKTHLRLSSRGGSRIGLRLCAVALAAVAVAGLMAVATLASSIGTQVRISQVGADGNPNFDGLAPAVAYNPQANQYLAVWEGDDVTDDETEIYGRLVSAAGVPAGPAFRISQVGPDGNTNFDAFRPAVAYSSRTNEFLVVWHGNAGADNQFEVYGQRVSAAGTEVGPNDFRISDAGPDGRGAFDASRPVVTYNSAANEFLVVWYGDEAVDNEFEIYGQRVSAAGTEVGPNDFRISDAGPDGDAGFDAFKPVAAYNPYANEFLVVWYGDDTAADELEIYGQRVSAAGAETGPNDFRISDMGPDGNTGYAAQRPSVTFDLQSQEYLVVWDGDDNTAPLVDNETEVYGQRLGPGGAEVGLNDFRISDAGPDGDTRFDAVRPVVAAGHGHEYLVVWYANETPRNQFEIYGQRVSTTGTPIGENDFIVSKLGGVGNAALDAQFPGLAYGERTNEYLAVWSADDGTPPMVDDEFEIFTRRAQGGSIPKDARPAPPKGRPKLILHYRKRQRIAGKRGVIVYVTSDQHASLLATARLSRAQLASGRKGTIRRPVEANRRYRLRFKLSRKLRRSVQRSLLRHKRVRVRVRVRVTNATGLSTTVRAAIRARR
jgi:hypothetical protein